MISSHLLSGNSATGLMNCIPLIYLEFTCVIDKDIDTTKCFDGFLDQKFTVQRFGQVSINVMSLDVRECGFEMFFDFFKIFLSGKAVQDDIEVSFSEGIGNTKSDTA